MSGQREIHTVKPNMTNYRMCRGTMVETGFGSGWYGNKFVLTGKTFTSRSLAGATRKMANFLRQAQITGSFFLKEEAKL